ncbi:hypothetical protein [Halalkalibacter oceani]|nr:hypothetical protein [Halalkalibacter oceani]
MTKQHEEKQKKQPEQQGQKGLDQTKEQVENTGKDGTIDRKKDKE